MTPRRANDWTHNGARFVCAAILLFGVLLGAITSFGNVPATATGEIEFAAGIDVNTAPPHELALLPGIGPALSEAIVLERENNGLFVDLDDLTRVKGIGERRVMGIAPHAVVQQPPANDSGYH